MAAWRRAIELSLGDADVERLTSIAQSRSEAAGRVERARILLAYREVPSFFAVVRAFGLHHATGAAPTLAIPPQAHRRITTMSPSLPDHCLARHMTSASSPPLLNCGACASCGVPSAVGAGMAP
jgi:hypothetical protein